MYCLKKTPWVLFLKGDKSGFGFDVIVELQFSTKKK